MMTSHSLQYSFVSPKICYRWYGKFCSVSPEIMSWVEVEFVDHSIIQSCDGLFVCCGRGYQCQKEDNPKEYVTLLCWSLHTQGVTDEWGMGMNGD